MATNRDIAATETDPEAPLSSALLKALALNPTAIAEGAAGAPRLRIGALQRLGAGTEVRIRNDGLAGAAAGTALAFSLMQKGTVTIEWKARRTDTTVVVTRSRPGEADTDIVIESGYSVTRTANVTVLPGDRVQLTWVGSNASDGISEARMRTNGADYWPVSVTGALEGNTYE